MGTALENLSRTSADDGTRGAEIGTRAPLITSIEDALRRIAARHTSSSSYMVFVPVLSGIYMLVIP
jgi:hypothetical protein